MSSLTLQAPAKVNLTLDILGKRPDGYHEMEMVMQSVSLWDQIHLDLGFPGGIRAESGLRFLPNDKGNLAVAAALAFRKATGQKWTDLKISIRKRIPVCAGTAGGSSDAAAVLRGLNTPPRRACPLRSWPGSGRRWAPTCPTASWEPPPWPRAGGEKLTPLPGLPPASCCCVSPGLPFPLLRCSGSGIGKSAGCARIPRECWPPWTRETCWRWPGGCSTSLKPCCPPHQRREIEGIKNTLIQAGALGATMSGTGPTVLGLFQEEALAEQAMAQLKENHDEVFLTQPV